MLANESVFLRAALEYAARGWPVFPCKPGQKTPLTFNGFKDATTDTEQIKKWWERTPDANIAIATGQANLLVLDVDIEPGGMVSLGQLQQECGPLPATLSQKTGGGGKQFFFRAPDEPLKNRVGLRPGLDIRANGGYVVVPPSIHPSGNPYKWNTDTTEPAEPPAWLVKMCSDNGGPSAPVAETIAEGERNQQLFSLACAMRRKGAAESEIMAALTAMNESRCRPPLPASELQKIAESSTRYTPEAKKEPEPFKPPEHWRLLDVSELDSWQTQPFEPLIEGLVAKGNFVLVAAPSQSMKTLLWLYISRFLVSGGRLFGKFDVRPVKKVLYLCLEDPDRRVKARLQDTDIEFEAKPEKGRLLIYVAPGLAISDPLCFEYLEQLIQEQGFELIVLDTYQKATPGLLSFDDKEQSIVLHRLANLTRKTGVTIITLDHLRKENSQKKRAGLSFDDIKGTGGKVQNADSVILLERDGHQLKLRAQSKDWDSEVGILLEVAEEGYTEGEKFKYAGELEDMVTGSKEKGENNRRAVLEAMPAGEWVKAETLARITGFSKRTVQRHLNSLFEAGLVDQGGENRLTMYCRLHDDRQNTACRGEL